MSDEELDKKLKELERRINDIEDALHSIGERY